MQHELQPDSLANLKFIMVDIDLGKTFVHGRIKSGDLSEAKIIHGRAGWSYRGYCEFKDKLLNRISGQNSG